MIYRMLRVIYHALSGCFTFANAIFSSVGIGLTAAICVMVLVSSILRLFTARFIGGQIVQADERVQRQENSKRVKADRYAKQHHKIRSGKEIS